jgi:transposase
MFLEEPDAGNLHVRICGGPGENPGLPDPTREADTMTKMGTKEGRANRARRAFTDEFKAGAARLILDEDKTVADVARDLDLTPSTLGGWVKQARPDRDGGKGGLRSDERAELVRLREELWVAKMERDILRIHRGLTNPRLTNWSTRPMVRSS